MAKSKLFQRKFRNWLLTLVLSRQDLKSIVGYTLTALQQDGARWQTQIDRLQPLYDGFDTGLVTHAGASAGRGSQTLLADTVYRLIKQYMKKAYKKSFAALEEDNADLYKLFFPQGRRQFSRATRQTIGTVFPAFIQTLADHKGAVTNGEQLLTDARALQTQWTTARKEQEKRKKAVKTASTDLEKDETDLLVELFGAYATLLAEYYRTPERVLDYFDFSVLPYSTYHASDDADPASPPTT